MGGDPDTRTPPARASALGVRLFILRERFPIGSTCLSIPVPETAASRSRASVKVCEMNERIARPQFCVRTNCSHLAWLRAHLRAGV